MSNLLIDKYWTNNGRIDFEAMLNTPNRGGNNNAGPAQNALPTIPATKTGN